MRVHLLTSVVARVEVEAPEPRTHRLSEEPLLLLHILMQAELLNILQTDSSIFLLGSILITDLRRVTALLSYHSVFDVRQLLLMVHVSNGVFDSLLMLLFSRLILIRLD